MAMRIKKGKSSSKGSSYAFLNVGANPRVSTVVKIMIAQRGSDVKYQKGNDNNADMKNSQSDFVIVISHFFVKAKYPI